MGRVASEISPRPDGTFLIELGAVLADRLPTIEHQMEYCISVPGLSPQEAKDLCFSNQIVRVRFLKDHDFYHIICPLYRLKEVQDDRALVPENAHFEHLKTFVTARYSIGGSDADDALSTSLESCVGDLIMRTNRVVAAHLMSAPESAGILTPSYDHGTFDYIYLLVTGNDPDQVRSERVALTLFKTGYLSDNYESDRAKAFRAYITGETEIDDVVRVLRSAKGYMEGGVLHLALLELAIVAEVATTRYIHAEYLRRGVSKNKLDDRKADITFSFMLNIELFALAPDARKPDRQVLGKVDRIRVLRNELMHSGTVASPIKEMRDFYVSVVQYVQYLNEITVQTIAV